VFSKKKDKPTDNKETQNQNTSSTPNSNIYANVQNNKSVNEEAEASSNFSSNTNAHVSNSQNSQAEAPKKTFSFVKNKNKADPTATAPSSDNININAYSNNFSSSIPSNTINQTSAPQTQTKTNSFNFIKNKTTVKEKESSINNTSNSGINAYSNPNPNLSSDKKPDFSTLDNLLNEKESYFNSILNQEKEKKNIKEEPINNNNINNIDDPVIITATQPSSSKGAFSFLKKKAPANTTNQSTTPKQIDKFDNINNPSNFDDNISDTKSFTSLRINNNIKQDNISVHLDKDEDDIKSIKDVNNTSTSFIRDINIGVNSANSAKNVSSLINDRKNSNLSSGKRDSKNIINTSSTTITNPENMKKRCYEEILKSEENFKELIFKIHQLKSKLLSKEKELSSLYKELEFLAQQEEEAINNNNFDEAQHIEETISENKEKIVKINSAISHLKSEMITYREQELLIIRNKWKILEETCNSFTKLKSQEEYQLETFTNTDINKHKNENIKIKKLKEKLDFLKNNLDSDKSYIDEEEEKITKVIKSQSSGVFEELEELNKNKDNVLDEIDKLKKLLDEKYSELDSVNKLIESKEIEIDAIKSNFNHEFNKLNYKKKNYEESLKDYQDQETLYENMKKNYQNDEIKFEEKTKNMKKNILDLENELKDYKSKFHILFDDLSKKEFLLKNENEILSKIHLIEMKYEKTNQQKEKDMVEIQKLELMNKKLEAEVLGWNMKIPSLEEEKKGFVVMKNFKEAGRVSNELKNILENKNKNLEKIEENKVSVNEMINEIENINIELMKIKENKEKEEKEFNINKYEYFTGYKEELNTLYGNLKGRNSSKNDLENVGEEIVFVDNELEALEKFDYILEKFPKKKNVEEQVQEEENNIGIDEKIDTSENNLNNLENESVRDAVSVSNFL
jgi:hypothetical protein